MSRRYPVSVVRNLAAAKSVEARVDEVNESMRHLGFTEEILMASRPGPGGSVRIAMSHSMAEISALGVVARAVAEGGSGLTASGGKPTSGQATWQENGAMLASVAVAKRLARRHEDWRRASSQFGSPGRWLELKRDQRSKRRGWAQHDK